MAWDTDLKCLRIGERQGNGHQVWLTVVEDQTNATTGAMYLTRLILPHSLMRLHRRIVIPVTVDVIDETGADWMAQTSSTAGPGTAGLPTMNGYRRLSMARSLLNGACSVSTTPTT